MIEEYTKRQDYYDQEVPGNIQGTGPSVSDNQTNIPAIRFEAVVSSDIIREGSEWKLDALCNGRMYTLYFEALPDEQVPPEELLRSQQAQIPCVVEGWQDEQNKIHAKIA